MSLFDPEGYRYILHGFRSDKCVHLCWPHYQMKPINYFAKKLIYWGKHIANPAFVRYVLPLRFKYQQMQLRRKVKKGGKIKVCFLAMNLGQWRYQRVCELMTQDSRFETHIVLCPSVQTGKSEQSRDLQQLRDFFASQGMPYIDWDENNDKSMADMRHDINPDIIFYPQQYKGVYYEEQSYARFRDKLLCLVPYGIANEEEAWTYGSGFHNRAWKLFYTNTSELNAAKRIACNRGRNVVVTGYPNMTEYLSPESCDVWKDDNPEVKRLIWAPHYSINADEDELYLSNFLWMAEGMIQLAREYKDRLQIAFKPHPKLRTKLYEHPDWGQAKADKYYQLWAEMPNTQLETGLFIDLFKTSDAMVHDCDSFQVEYLYVNKPVMFVEQSVKQQNTTELRKRAIACHYIGRNMDDIRQFVEMVLRDEDSMKEQRQQFFEECLLPEHGTDVALNIYNDIVTTLKL